MSKILEFGMPSETVAEEILSMLDEGVSPEELLAGLATAAVDLAEMTPSPQQALDELVEALEG